MSTMSLKDKVIYLHEHKDKLEGYMIDMVVNAYNRIKKWKSRGWVMRFDHNESIMLHRAYDRMIK